MAGSRASAEGKGGSQCRKITWEVTRTQEKRRFCRRITWVGVKKGPLQAYHVGRGEGEVPSNGRSRGTGKKEPVNAQRITWDGERNRPVKVDHVGHGEKGSLCRQIMRDSEQVQAPSVQTPNIKGPATQVGTPSYPAKHPAGERTHSGALALKQKRVARGSYRLSAGELTPAQGR